MANTLVIAEHADGALKKATLHSVTIARDLAARTGAGYDIVLMGPGATQVAPALAGYGAGSIFTIEGDAFASYLAQPYANALAALAQEIGASYVVTTASTTGKDVMPRLAGILGAGMVADCVGLAGEGADVLYKRPMYAGNILATVRVNAPKAVLTVRASEVDAATETGGATPVKAFAADPGQVTARYVKFEGTKSERPDLADASVVVSGGRGLKDAGGFESIMNPLADFFGGAIGATRAAVDSGFCPNDLQVGQTGKIVSPNLYIAVALSGAIQHLAGMKASKVIVAINKDEEAPVFQVADYGLVADAFKAVPEFLEKVKAG